MQLKREMATLKFLPLKPRILELKKGKNGYGFYLRMEQNGKGKILDCSSQHGNWFFGLLTCEICYLWLPSIERNTAAQKP